jgi:putative mRNA 3-end processing factor
VWPGLLEMSDAGLYCPPGDFHIDPWRPVQRAVVTHAHSDHARPGSARYFAAAPGVGLLGLRLDPGAEIAALAYGEPVELGEARVSLHPAGHILGSAQVRIEQRGRVVVVGGDHKLVADDPTCAAFEPLQCDLFVSEATFALPIYRWPPSAEVFAEIHAWWRENQSAGRTSVLFAYAVGKAQRLLAGLDPSYGPIGAHGAIRRFLPAYAAAGVRLPAVIPATEQSKALRGMGLVLAPPSSADSPWLRKFGRVSTAFASGWMQIRGTRRRRNLDRGFVLSDHADFAGLLETIRRTGARRVAVTHGYTSPFARLLRERGLDAAEVRTRFVDLERGDAVEPGLDDDLNAGAESSGNPPSEREVES